MIRRISLYLEIFHEACKADVAYLVFLLLSLSLFSMHEEDELG